MSSSAILALLYLFIACICVAVSTWSTYHGFLTMLDWLAIPVAAVIAAGLLACDLAILDRRRNGQGIAGVVFALFIFTAASAASNFNYFYTNFMRGSIVVTRLREASNTFDDNIRLLQSAIPKDEAQAKRTLDIEQLLRNLANEVNDPSAVGWGAKALAVAGQIEARLQPQTIQRNQLPPAKAAPDLNDKTLKEYSRRVIESLRAEQMKNPFEQVNAVIDRARADKAARYKQLELVTGASDDIGFAARIDAIRDLDAQTRSLEGAVRRAMAQLGIEPKFSLGQPTQWGGLELNSIPNTIRSGFTDRPDINATMFAAATALLIDLLPLLVALLVLRRPKGAVIGRTGSSFGGGFKHPDILGS